MRNRCKILWALAGLLAAMAAVGASPTVDEDLKDYYETAKPPKMQLVAAEGRDAGVFTELQVPAILAALKYQLDQGAWSNLARADRKRLLDILDDPGMKLIYTGLQSSLATAAGGQTIDASTVKINQDGWYSSGGGGVPRSSFDIAKIILHELGHVYQERYNYLPRPGSTKEWFPEELEKQLPASLFTPETIHALTKVLNRDTGGPCNDISGSWQGVLEVVDVDGSTAIDVGQKRTLRGDNFNIVQKDCEITLKFFNNEIRGTMKGGAVVLSQKVTGALGEATLTLSGGMLKVNLRQDIPGGKVVSEGLLSK